MSAGTRREFLQAAGATRLEELRHDTGDEYAYQPTVLLKQEATAGECAQP